MSQQFTPLSTLAPTPTEASFQDFSVTPTFTTPETEKDKQSPPSPTSPTDSGMTSLEEKDNPTCPSTQPTLVLDRDGDRITRIRVLCGCGQSVTIKCDYLENSEKCSSEANSSASAPAAPADSSPRSDSAST